MKRAGSLVELVSIVVIALAILVGGNALLAGIAQARVPAWIALVALGFFQFATLRRDFAARTPAARLLVTRDIVFLVAIAAAILFVVKPQRWAIGATISAVEFGLVIEICSRFVAREP